MLGVPAALVAARERRASLMGHAPAVDAAAEAVLPPVAAVTPVLEVVATAAAPAPLSADPATESESAPLAEPAADAETRPAAQLPLF
jgi:hypothetical protein